jgi:hypothetical protein
MKKDSTAAGIVALGLETARENVAASFERFCLTAGIATLSEMMEQDAIELCGVRHGRSVDRRGYRWGGTMGKLGFHGGKVPVERPRVRARSGAEMAIPSWEAAHAEDWLGRWAMSLMLINVSTRRFGRAVRLPEGGIAAPPGAGVSKSAVSSGSWHCRRNGLKAWMAADLARLDLLAIQIDGMYITNELTMLGRDRHRQHWCQTPARHAGRRHRERRRGAGTVGQLDRARAGSETLPSGSSSMARRR